MSKQDSLDYLDNLLWLHHDRIKINIHVKELQVLVSRDEPKHVEIEKNFILLKPTPFEMYNTHVCPSCKTRSVFNFNGERNNFCGNCGKRLNWLRQA